MTIECIEDTFLPVSIVEILPFSVQVKRAVVLSSFAYINFYQAKTKTVEKNLVCSKESDIKSKIKTISLRSCENSDNLHLNIVAAATAISKRRTFTNFTFFIVE